MCKWFVLKLISGRCKNWSLLGLVKLNLLLRKPGSVGCFLLFVAYTVSFGAAPAYLVYKFGLEGLPGITGICVSSLLMIGSGLRLARFNISMISYNKESFSGLPTPAQALTIAGFVLWMSADKSFPLTSMQIVLAWLSTALALLMVSKVNYDTLPKPTAESFRQKPLQMALYIGAMFCVLLFHSKAFFLAMLF